MIPSQFIPSANPPLPPLPSPALQNPSVDAGPEVTYNEIMRRLPLQDKTRIETDLQIITPAQLAQGINGLAPLIQAGSWEQINFLHADNPLYALAALKQGRISSHQFGTFQLFWSSCRYHNSAVGGQIQKIPLFLPNDTINPVAYHLIQQTMQDTHKNRNSQDYQHPGLTQEKINIFFSKMRSQPLSEQFFLHVPKITYPQGQSNQLKIQNRSGFNIFGYCNTDPNQAEKTAFEMVPSLGMMQTFLKTQYAEENALQLNPVFGLPEHKDLENVTQRTISLPFPNLIYNIKGLPIPAHHLANYGMYHSTFASSVPIDHRKLYNKIGKIAERLNLNKLSNPFGMQLFTWYPQTTSDSETLNTIFWETMTSSIRNAKMTPLEIHRFLTKIQDELSDDPIIQANQSKIKETILAMENILGYHGFSGMIRKIDSFIQDLV